ncbi:MAG: hypothetical protein ACT4PK_07200 [Gammaproteobacteria bacterium]
MAALRPLLAMTFLALVGGCAHAPITTTALPSAAIELPAPLPLVTSSGLVIGTLSYQFVEAGAAETGPRWVVHVERVDAPAQDYALPVDVDLASRRGVFTGALPAGVYALKDASAPNGRYAPTRAAVFEVQAGEVRDAGHYALNPVRGL